MSQSAVIGSARRSAKPFVLRLLLTAVWLASVGLLMGAARPLAAQTPDPVVLQPAEALEFRAYWGGTLSLGVDSHSAEATLLLAVDEPSAVTFSGYFADGTAVDDLASTTVAEQDGTTSVRLSFDVREADERSGWVAIRAGSDPPTTLPFSVVRELSGWTFAKQVIVPLLFVATLFITRHLTLKTARGRRHSWRDPLGVDKAKWSFKDSWASNLAAVGGLLTAVLASTSLADSVARGLDLSGVLALSLGFTFVALVAPLVSGALQDGDSPTYGGLMAAGFLTSFAVIGQVGTITMVLHRSGSSLWIGFVVNVMLLAILLLYVWRSVTTLADSTTPRSSLL